MSIGYPQNALQQDPSLVLQLLQQLGVDAELAPQIASSMGEELIWLIERDPYALCELIGAPFLRIEAYAQRRALWRDHGSRVPAGILFCLSQEETSGHCFTPQQSFVQRTAKYLRVTPERVEEVVIALSKKGRVLLRGDHLWLRNMSSLEDEVASRVLALCRTAPLTRSNGQKP